ncbi:MAG TPA: outer membrane beta-barrel protein, partial [Longimicrobiales bacterium]|nr:outer membrane beta-barrel protein [Longimicrobiales bacterium]
MPALRILGLSVAILAAVPPAASAQLTLEGGVNLASFLGEDAGGSRSVTGLNLGGSLGLVEVGPVRILGEVYYRQKGGSGTLAGFQEASAAGQSVEVGIDYVEIPVLVRLDLRRGGGVTPYLQGGPAFGWKLQCGVKAT